MLLFVSCPTLVNGATSRYFLLHMENRFGLKDLFLFLLVCGLIVLVLLQMKQYDRQWDVVQEVRNQVNDQTKDLARIERMLQQGVVSTGLPTTTHAAPPDVDKRVRRIHSAPDFATGDDVVDVLLSPPDKLTALINVDLYSQQIQSYVLDTLIDRDPVTLAWEPRVATDWKVSPDGLTIDFNMRRGITFSNGDPLTADDVVYTVQMVLNEKIEAPAQRVYYDKVKSCKKTGDYSVEFVFSEPYYLAFEVAGSTQILSKKFYSQFTPQQINESTGLLLGSGPYRLPDPTSWKPEPGKPVVLVRNERYWGVPGGPDRLVWRIIELPAARMTALRNGEIDMFYQPAADQFDAAKADPQLSSTHNTFAIPTLDSGYRYIGWNEKRADKPTFFADQRVRKAMTMLIDRQRIIRDIVHGYATISTGPFNPMSPQTDPSIKPLPYDPEQAQKLLAEAGFKRQNNALFGPDGKQFSFELMYPAGSSTGKRAATFLVDAMAQAGIVVRPAATEWTVLLQRTKERNFDALLAGWGGGAVEDDPQQIFSSSAIKGVGDNYVQYSNPKLDDAIDRARRTMDESQRMKIWHEVHRILHEDQPYTFLYADEELDIVDKRFKGVEPTKFGIVKQKNEWYVPRSMQKYHD